MKLHIKSAEHTYIINFLKQFQFLNHFAVLVSFPYDTIEVTHYLLLLKIISLCSVTMIKSITSTQENKLYA